MDEIVLRINQENPDPRSPCVLCLDTSSSMTGEPIAELWAGVAQFVHDVDGDPVARRRVETEIIAFGGTARRVVPFTEVRELRPPTTGAAGVTPMADALAMAAVDLAGRVELYDRSGLDHDRGLIVVMSDGRPTDGPQRFDGVVRELNRYERAGAFAVLPVAVGEDADVAELARTSTTHEPVRLHAVGSFRDFFRWLSQSLVQTSRGAAGSQVRRPPLAWSGE